MPATNSINDQPVGGSTASEMKNAQPHTPSGASAQVSDHNRAVFVSTALNDSATTAQIQLR